MRLTVYAHHSAIPEVALHVLYFLGELRKLGLTICFVSNSPLSARSVAKLNEVCDRIIQRQNTGFDFAMWQQALREYQLADVSELLLTNSSIVGPLRPLREIWQKAESHPSWDFWGLTDNVELVSHLQSYFLSFRRPVLASPAFARFWEDILPFRNKWLAIFSYEVTMTGWLEENGFTSGVLFPKEEVWRCYRSGLGRARKVKDRLLDEWLPGYNTTLFYPEILLKMGMPFLKLSLLTQGGARITAGQAHYLLQGRLPADVFEELRPSQSDATKILDGCASVRFSRDTTSRLGLFGTLARIRRGDSQATSDDLGSRSDLVR